MSSCWDCGLAADGPDDGRRYCRRCGARLCQDCPYCGAGVAVSESCCPTCRKPFRRCPTHWILYSVDQERCAGNGQHECHTALADCATSHLCEGVNAQRTRAVEFRQGRPSRADASRQVVYDAGVRISRVVSRHNCLLFGTSTGEACAVSLRDGTRVWSDAASGGHDLSTHAPVPSSRYVCHRAGSVIFVHDILSGLRVSQIEVEGLWEYHLAPLGGNLVVVGRTLAGDDVLRSYPLASGAREAQHALVVQTLDTGGRQPQIPLVTDAEAVWFVDRVGRLRSWRPSGEQPDVAYGNAEGHVLRQLMLVRARLAATPLEREFYMAAQRNGQSCVLAWSADRASALESIIEPVPELIHSIAFSYPHLVLALDSGFRAYDVAEGDQGPVWEHRVVRNSAITEFMLVRDGNRLYIVYALRQGSPRAYIVYSVEALKAESASSQIQVMSPDERPCLLYASDGTMVGCLESGRIEWHPVP